METQVKKNNTSKILVVDDDAIICESCRRILAREGFKVDTETNPNDGLKMVDHTDYDAILLDIRMDEMDGYKFLKFLRKKNPDIPVIMITGYPSYEGAMRSMELGADEFVQKPFSPVEIVQIVKKQVTRLHLLKTFYDILGITNL